MTIITLYDDGYNHRITAQGHATGSVEVCAAISAITGALAAYLTQYSDGSVILEDGNCDISFRGEKGAYQVAAVGLSLIAESYPEYASVKKVYSFRGEMV